MARKGDIEERDADADGGSSSDPRVYELAFHLDPELSESDAKKSYEAILDAIKDNGGAIVAEGAPEKMALAYTISRTENAGRRDFNSAYFCWVAYEAAGEGHDAVVAAARAESRIIRFLDIKTTKESAKHSAELREMRERVPEKPADESPVSDTELDAALEEAAA